MKMYFTWILLLSFVNGVRLDLADIAVGEPFVTRSVETEDQVQLPELIEPDQHLDVKRDQEESRLSELVVPSEHIDDKRSQEQTQLSEPVVPNEHVDKKRSHYDDYDEPDNPRTQSSLSKVTLPKIINMLHRPKPSEEPEQGSFTHSMTNIYTRPSILPRPLLSPTNNPAEAPKYLFSSVHMKLYPKVEETREDALLRDLEPDIQAGIIGLPELIEDAPNSDSFEKRNNRPSSLIQIFKTPTSNRIPEEESMSNLDNPTIFEGSAEQSSVEENTHPSSPLLDYKPSSYNNDFVSFGAISFDSRTKKPLLKLNVKSNLRITKIKLEYPTTPESTTDLTESETEADEIDPITTTEQTNLKQKSKVDKPHCPSGGDFVDGTKDLWKGFHKSDSWSRSFGAVADTAKKATKAVGSCFKSIWKDVIGVFGYGDKHEDKDKPSTNRGVSNTTTPTALSSRKPRRNISPKGKGLWTKTKETAKSFKEGFSENVAKPVSNFFTDISEKTRDAFSRRSTDGNEFTNVEDTLEF